MKLADATILLVDDEPELLEIFAVWLRRNGCTVLTAVNGAEALKILQEHPVNALISDIRMPIMDGMTLVRKLFELQIVVPSIIFVSGFGDVDAREMYALGVEAMLAKPLSRKQLMHALECSLKDRTELWLDPIPGPITQTVDLTFESLETTRAFAIGRGGCCFHLDRPLLEDQPVQLCLHFTRENCRLEATGIVRWCQPKEQRAGIEFAYLDPACRSWVITTMLGEVRRCFIPSC